MNKLLAFLLLSVFIFISCGQQNGVRSETFENKKSTNEQVKSVPTPPQKETTEKKEIECKICDFDFEKYKGELKKEEINGLLLALNDEYMAWATYDQINMDFNNPRPFINIQKAENKHAERLKAVFKSYDLPIPENKWIGNAPKFQNINDACKAGVEGEIANRDLYTKLFKSTTREDILIVYKALQRASEENHLPAFKRCSEGRGRGYGQGKGLGRGRRNNP